MFFIAGMRVLQLINMIACFYKYKVTNEMKRDVSKNESNKVLSLVRNGM